MGKKPGAIGKSQVGCVTRAAREPCSVIRQNVLKRFLHSVPATLTSGSTREHENTAFRGTKHDFGVHCQA